MCSWPAKMKALSFSIFVLVVPWSFNCVGCSEQLPQGQIYGEMAEKIETYGRCWFDAMKVAKTECVDGRLSTRAVSTVGLMMYNCALEKSESRRIDCGSDPLMSKCERLTEEIREDSHRKRYFTSRGMFMRFCEQWRQDERPKVFEKFGDEEEETTTASTNTETTSSGAPESVTLYSLARSSMENFLELTSKLWGWSQSGLTGLMTKYQLQVRLNHAYDHCKSTVSQLSASMAIHISNTWRMWKLLFKIVSTDVRFCESDQDDAPLNAVGFMMGLYAAFYNGALAFIISRFGFITGKANVFTAWQVVIMVSYCLETLLIAYAVNNCHGTDETKLEFLTRERDEFRTVFMTIHAAFFAVCALLELRELQRAE